MRPGHRRIFPIKIQKAREEMDKLRAKQKREEDDQEENRKREKQDQEENRKREKMKQKSKREMEDELAKIEMAKKLERARQKRGHLNTSIATGEVEHKEGSMAHGTAASADLPSDKLHHAFISHKKKHTAFGDHYEMLSIRLKVKFLTNCTSTSAPYHLLHEGHAQVAGLQRFYGL